MFYSLVANMYQPTGYVMFQAHNRGKGRKGEKRSILKVELYGYIVLNL